MEYSPLKTLNPSDEDLTIKSSHWIRSRLMPGRGFAGVSFPTIQHNDQELLMVTSELSSLNVAPGLYVFVIVSAGIGGIFPVPQANIPTMQWNGLWVSSPTAGMPPNSPIIGGCIPSGGLVTPFNTFNIGYRYRRGWRPSRV